MNGERQAKLWYELLPRVDIVMVGSDDNYWGSVKNLSRSGVSLTLGQHLKTIQRVTIRFRFKGTDQQEIIEDLTAKVIWKTGDNARLEFDPPLTPGSPALQKASYLAAYLVDQESRRSSF
jgi:hypothetical protein